MTARCSQCQGWPGSSPCKLPRPADTSPPALALPTASRVEKALVDEASLVHPMALSIPWRGKQLLLAASHNGSPSLLTRAPQRPKDGVKQFLKKQVPTHPRPSPSSQPRAGSTVWPVRVSYGKPAGPTQTLGMHPAPSPTAPQVPPDTGTCRKLNLAPGICLCHAMPGWDQRQGGQLLSMALTYPSSRSPTSSEMPERQGVGRGAAGGLGKTGWPRPIGCQERLWAYPGK